MSSAIGQVEVGHLDALVEHVVRHTLESADGDVPTSPVPRNASRDLEALRANLHRRLTTPVGELGWGRTWAVFDGAKIVGAINIHEQYKLVTALHRANLSMGLEPAYRGKGLGKKLMTACLDWAKGQKQLDYIDLGVFATNQNARRLYEKFGFIETGRLSDFFRVDGHRIDDIQMTLELNELRG